MPVGASPLVEMPIGSFDWEWRWIAGLFLSPIGMCIHVATKMLQSEEVFFLPTCGGICIQVATQISLFYHNNLLFTGHGYNCYLYVFCEGLWCCSHSSSLSILLLCVLDHVKGFFWMDFPFCNYSCYQISSIFVLLTGDTMTFPKDCHQGVHCIFDNVRSLHTVPWWWYPS